MQSIDLVTTLSADLSSLEAIVALLPEPQSLIEYYAVARHGYLCGDLDGLQSILEKIRANPWIPKWFIDLIDLRWHIRLKQRHFSEAQVKIHFSEITENCWRAEMSMVLGMYFEEMGDYQQSLLYYRNSASDFYQCLIPNKALTAEYNALIVQSLAFPQKRYLVAYQGFIRRALDAKNNSLAGVAMANLAREYQLLGLYELSILRAQEAVQILSTANFGSLNYFLSVAQLLDLYLKTHRYRSSIPLYEELKSSPFQETSGIIEVLNSFCEKTKEYQLSNLENNRIYKIPIPWLERLKLQPENFSDEEKNNLSNNESEIINLLSSGSKSLTDLTNFIYGDSIQWESALARIKQTIYRIRKKFPELIIFRNGQYELAD